MSKNEMNINLNNGSVFVTLLTLMFIGLKLSGIGAVANWSWWWVLSPIWISLLIFIIIFIVIGFVFMWINYYF